MNTHKNITRIVCYGDSNTWGQVPLIDDKRHPANVRWTGKLQELLGNSCEIIEEGLCSRTVMIEDPKREGMNGLVYFTPCIKSQNPVDVVIIMLGSNDFKTRYNRTPEQTVEGLEKIVQIALEKGKNETGLPPKVILMAPPLIDESIEYIREKAEGATEKLKKYAVLCKQLAEKYNTAFLDLTTQISPSKADGGHLDAEEHKKLAELLFHIISG